jgi:hypothetical protein
MRTSTREELENLAHKLSDADLKAHIRTYDQLRAGKETTAGEAKVFSELFCIFTMELGLRASEEKK